MAYGIKYTVDFSEFQLRISQKDYVGSTASIKAGSPSVRHSWEADDPVAPIKGSSLTANIIGVPLLDFYADNDDEYKGELYHDTDLLFSGFLVQDDCIEDVDDLVHPVSLSFTDNLGLLKDVSFKSVADGLSISRNPLYDALKGCLLLTGVVIPLEIFCTLKEDSQDTDTSFFEQTLIAKESFMKGYSEYDNCYSVIEKILSRFNASLIQANGQWNIIRWFEFAPTSFKYDDTLTPLFTYGVYDHFKVFGLNQNAYPQYGLNKRVKRPYKIVKETFNYEQTPELLHNPDLKQLGASIGTSTVGDIRYDDYELSGFTNVAGDDAFIRVETNTVLDLEIQRYIYQPYGSTGSFSSNGIEVQAGDRFDLSVTYRAANDTSDSSRYVVKIFVLPDTSGDVWNLIYLAGDLSWHINTSLANIVYDEITTDEDLTEWRTLNVASLDPRGMPPLPVSGILYFQFFAENGQDPNEDSFSKEFRFTYTPYISESIKITGQKQTRTQDIDTKNINEITQEIDDSPRNCLNGTLFLATSTGLLQDRSSSWNTGKRLGEITTLEIKQWRSKARTILEGTIYGRAVTDLHISPLTTFTNPAFPDLKFVPGRMDIEYAERRVSATLHELYETGEAAVTSTYTFEYIYNNQ